MPNVNRKISQSSIAASKWPKASVQILPAYAQSSFPAHWLLPEARIVHKHVLWDSIRVFICRADRHVQRRALLLTVTLRENQKKSFLHPSPRTDAIRPSVQVLMVPASHGRARHVYSQLL